MPGPLDRLRSGARPSLAIGLTAIGFLILIAIAVGGRLGGSGDEGGESQIGAGDDGAVVRCVRRGGTFRVTRDGRASVTVTARRPVSTTVSESATERGDAGSVTVTARATREAVARASVTAEASASATVRQRGRARACGRGPDAATAARRGIRRARAGARLNAERRGAGRARAAAARRARRLARRRASSQAQGRADEQAREEQPKLEKGARQDASDAARRQARERLAAG